MEEGTVNFVREDCYGFAGGEVDDLFEQRLREDGAGGVLRVTGAAYQSRDRLCEQRMVSKHT